MIVLKISNSSEVVASKVGKFLEFLTPDNMDQSAVEDPVSYTHLTLPTKRIV